MYKNQLNHCHIYIYQYYHLFKDCNHMPPEQRTGILTSDQHSMHGKM